MSNRLLRWGILATGRIAEKFARGVAASRSGRLVAVGSRGAESARAFAQRHGIGERHAHGSYEALLADAEVDAVYIATPHPMHLEWTLKAARAGKHILCEKPMGMNRAEAERMVAAAREHGVFLMEAFMYRCHPQTARIAELVRGGALGEIRVAQATVGYDQPFNPESRAWNNELGGGGILDVGCYPVSFSRFVAGAAAGKLFLDPVAMSGAGVTHPETGVDEWTAATLQFETGMIAQVACSVGVQQENTARIYGTKGWLHVVEPWTPTRGDDKIARMRLHRAGGGTEEIAIPYQAGEYTWEADTVARCVGSGKREAGEMSWADTLGNAAALDRWLEIAGVRYSEKKSIKI